MAVITAGTVVGRYRVIEDFCDCGAHIKAGMIQAACLFCSKVIVDSRDSFFKKSAIKCERCDYRVRKLNDRNIRPPRNPISREIAEWALYGGEETNMHLRIIELEKKMDAVYERLGRLISDDNYLSYRSNTEEFIGTVRNELNQLVSKALVANRLHESTIDNKLNQFHDLMFDIFMKKGKR